MHPDRIAEHSQTFEELHPNYVKNAKAFKPRLHLNEGGEEHNEKFHQPKPFPKIEVSEVARLAHNQRIIHSSKVLANRVKTAPSFFAKHTELRDKIERRIRAKALALIA